MAVQEVPKTVQVAPRDVASAIVIKDEDIFLVAERDGSVPGGNKDGFGLYHRDCRYLNCYELRIGDAAPTSLIAAAGEGTTARFELTNGEFQVNGDKIPAQSLALSLTRTVDAGKMALRDELTITNHSVEQREVPVSIGFDSGFEDIFEIRGLHPSKIGRRRKPQWKDGTLIFCYAGADHVMRSLEVAFEPEARAAGDSKAEWVLHLKPAEEKRIKITMRIAESRPSDAAEGEARSRTRVDREWLKHLTSVSTDVPVIGDVLKRCFLDLNILRSRLHGCHFFAAGLPWFGALFGRDSIIAALQSLAYDAEVAGQTIRLLAQLQAEKCDEWRDAEPGKILHELRRGELADLNEIPQTPYYGSVDATPLFLILLGEHANWTGDLRTFHEIREHVDRAIAWIDSNCERHGGYLSYETKSGKGLGNQGWKDSGDSIVNEDGSLAKPPIAMAEVQGYVYRAKLLIAALYARTGDEARAEKLRAEAQDLKRRFNRDFWIESRSLYALALQKNQRPAVVMASNQGQALWTGIVDESHADGVRKGLMAEDMFSGWGVRTLSAKERRYNPIGYHLGTVWPHDNSTIAAGMRRYGFDETAAAIFDGMVQAAHHFENYRLPEVFAGFAKSRNGVPVRYPVACHPQAWAAGSIPFMLTNLLGLKGQALDKRLRVIRPVLPEGMNCLELRHLRVGDATVDLRFTRSHDREIKVDVTNKSGDLDVQLS